MEVEREKQKEKTDETFGFEWNEYVNRSDDWIRLIGMCLFIWLKLVTCLAYHNTFWIHAWAEFSGEHFHPLDSSHLLIKSIFRTLHKSMGMNFSKTFLPKQLNMYAWQELSTWFDFWHQNHLKSMNGQKFYFWCEKWREKNAKMCECQPIRMFFLFFFLPVVNMIWRRWLLFFK